MLLFFGILILIIGCSDRFKSFLYNPREASKRLRVATVAMECDVDPENNRKKIVNIVNDIINDYPDVELIVFGEAVLGWFRNQPETAEYHRRIAETIPGITTQLVSELALKHEIFITFGLVERDNDRIYNSQVLINPQGEIIAVHRKKNLRIESFHPGDTPITFVNIDGIKTGIVICSDIRSDLTTKEIFRNEPALIIFSNADWTNDWDKRNFAAGYFARRFDSWVVSSNRFGDEADVHWDGHIEISNPLGDLCVLAKSKEQYVYYDIGFDSDQSKTRKFMRKLYLKISLACHVLRNIDIAYGYLRNE
jgi:(R)-amidase